MREGGALHGIICRAVRRLRGFFFALVLLFLGERAARAASDPTVAYSTITTPHFRITYHTGCEDVAHAVADVAESIHANMVAHVGWEPRDLTEILLTDLTDSANGSAVSLPYNAVRLNVTAPDDLSPLGDVDDWYTELVTHEYTHILHVDQIHGIPAIVNAVVGKTYAPNQVQPRWILEGLATYHESARTSGGRVRASLWDMYMRADVLENNVATLDQMSHYVRRWPQGNIWYLYGSLFLDWIAHTYGEETLRFVAEDYGTRVVPWGINRSIRRATGSTYEQLYPRWVASMRATYLAQIAAAARDPMASGTPLTARGQDTQHPRFRTVDGREEILFFSDDGHERGGFWALPINRDVRGAVSAAGAAYLVARTNGPSYGELAPDGALVFSSQETSRDLLTYNDLFELLPGERSEKGLENTRTRLTEGLRAVEPSLSPDGKRVVFVVNGAGTRRLFIADVVKTAGRRRVEHVRQLVQNTRFEQSFTPRWSPDGTRVAYSVWTRGGFRDIRVVDVRDGSWSDIMQDRAQDGDPSWSADSAWLYFHSDRTGIFNVYAWSLAERALYRVTNVAIGAFQPEVSRDGRTLVFVSYGKRGFDLSSMPLDPKAFVLAAPYIDTHPAPPLIRELGPYDTEPYQPLRTLVPRNYSIKTEPGNFGQRFTVLTQGSDLAGLHGITASLFTEVERPEPQGSIAYSYGRLPVDFGVSFARSIAPRGGFSLGKFAPVVVQENTSLSASLSVPIAHAFDSQSLAVTYSLNRVGIDLPFAQHVDPYDTPHVPFRGLVGSVSMGYSYTNVERSLYSVSGQRGFAFSANLSTTQPWLASQFSGLALTSDLTSYFRMPWSPEHTVAVHLGGGMAGGSFPGHGSFYIGNFVELPIADVLRNVLLQGGYVLRGYEPVAASGSTYGLLNTEYRFPLLNVDRGLSTLPVFLNRITGAVFADYGTAFDDPNKAVFKLGSGAEVSFDTLLGYYASFIFRVGYARGFHSGGGNHTYFVAAVPY